MPRKYAHKDGRKSQRDQIIDFVRDNPHCNMRAVMEKFDLSAEASCGALLRLKRDGVLKSCKPPGVPLQTWSIINHGEPGEVDTNPPRRVFASEWKGHERDDMLTAFFGKAAA